MQSRLSPLSIFLVRGKYSSFGMEKHQVVGLLMNGIGYSLAK